jgi:hypothetical protein
MGMVLTPNSVERWFEFIDKLGELCSPSVMRMIVRRRVASTITATRRRS